MEVGCWLVPDSQLFEMHAYRATGAYDTARVKPVQTLSSVLFNFVKISLVRLWLLGGFILFVLRFDFDIKLQSNINITFFKIRKVHIGVILGLHWTVCPSADKNGNTFFFFLNSQYYPCR